MITEIYITIIFFISFLIIIIPIYVFFTIYNQKVLHYDFGYKNANLKICFIAGVHGNEPAAALLLQELIKKKYFKNSNVFIRVIPVVNRFGLNTNFRFQNNIFYPDINRNFRNDKGIDKTSKKLIELTKDMDIIIDFHEGWGFHKINEESIGSTVITGNLSQLAEEIKDNLNYTISNKNLKFSFLKKPCRIQNSFGCYNYKKNKRYILIETSGQDDIQKLSLRQEQVKIVIDTVLNFYNVGRI